MPPTSARDSLELLDWILFRHVHEYLDVAGRPLGEGRSAAFRHMQTEMQSCPYAGGRHHHVKPMNVSALRNITPAWEQILIMLSWLSRRYQARRETAIRNFDDLLLVTSGGVFLADFLALRRHRPLHSGKFPLLFSGLYKVCLGFQLATYLGSMQARFAQNQALEPLPDSAGFYEFLEAYELLIGEDEVCAGSPAMIMEAYDAMLGKQAIGPDNLPDECGPLEIDWDKHDLFTDHASFLWDDLVMYVIRTSQICPELTDPRLPDASRQRLNGHLQRRTAQLLEGQTGLVVDIARAAQSSIANFAAGEPAERPHERSTSAAAEPGSLAAAVATWLSKETASDMRNYGDWVAEELKTQLAGYELLEASVLAGLNQHADALVQALGCEGYRSPLTATALSQICGRTLRDWDAAS
jgi:hypothetical protein